jgi:hypothetical protein
MNKVVLTLVIIVAVLGIGGFVYYGRNKPTTPLSTGGLNLITNTPEATANKGSSNTPSPTISLTNVKDTADMVTEVAQISLTISSPFNGSTVTTSKATVKGKTLPKAEVFANEAEGLADANGNFSLSVSLDDGENSIIVTAVDENGNVAEKEVMVTYDVGK